MKVHLLLVAIKGQLNWKANQCTTYYVSKKAFLIKASQQQNKPAFQNNFLFLIDLYNVWSPWIKRYQFY